MGAEQAGARMGDVTPCRRKWSSGSASSMSSPRTTLHTPEDLLTDRQRERLLVVFTNPDHLKVQSPGGSCNR
jgi:hypothetical protein